MGCCQQQDRGYSTLSHSLSLIKATSQLTLPRASQYQIDPTVRNHNEPLSRPALIEILGSSIRSLSSPPLPNSTVPDRPTLTVTANLTTPDLVLVPVVLKSVYGLSIVEGKLWSGKKGKKFNLDGIGMEARRSKAEAEGPTGVRGTLELEKSGEEVGTVEVEKKEVE